MSNDIKTGSLTCPLLWTDCHWKGGPYSFVVFHHPMGNPISEHDDHTVVWTLRDFLV